MLQIFLQNATAILLQNAIEVYCKMRQISHYKIQQFYYKMQQLLQIATILLQSETAVTKCKVYYKLGQYKPLVLSITCCKYDKENHWISKDEGRTNLLVRLFNNINH